MARSYHLFALLQIQKPSFRDKKSFSTFNWPICRCVDLFAGLGLDLVGFIEDLGGPIEQGSFPGRDHCGVNPIALGKFGGGLFVAEGGQGNSGLEIGSVLFAFLAHVSSFPFTLT